MLARTLQMTQAQMVRVLDVMQYEADPGVQIQAQATVSQSGKLGGAVEVDAVTFGFDNAADPLLHDLSFTLEPGAMVALVGPRGSGKTTIINLLPRFYEVTQGRVSIDKQDIRDFTLASLRRNVGIVQQDIFLFSATIQDNIAYGASGATKEDVIEAAKVAQLHDHIMSLPHGYDTWVGERGATLSGGQRQRLSIARTVLIDPPVLILDDSTSSVDVETERMIHQAMTDVMKGRTTFIIAHRLSSVREADHIIVLKDGEITEQGSHAELMAIGGTYREIYDLQLRPQEEVLLDAAISGDDGGDN